MAKGYTDKTAIENYMLKTIDASFDDQVTEWIEGVEETIDEITGRNFKADTTATARLFDGVGSNKLKIDECVSVSTVEIGNDEYGGSFRTINNTGSNRYFTEPANHTAKSLPVTLLVLNADHFLAGRQNQRITAKWGYSVNVPKAIKRAATIFVAGIINEQNIDNKNIKSERIGNYQVTYSDGAGNNSFADFEEAMRTLDSYKRYHI